MPQTQALNFAIRRRTLPLHHSTTSTCLMSTCRRNVPIIRPWLQSSRFPMTSYSRALLRSFNHQSSLLTLYRQHLSQPQLPFLHPSSSPELYRLHLNSRSFLTRYLSTERKRRWRQTLRWQLRFHAYLWPTLLLVSLILTGVRQAELERQYPTPRDWKFWPRWWLRGALFEEDRCNNVGGGYLREGWAKVAKYYRGVVDRCEQELQLLHKISVEDELLIDGVGKVGGGGDIGDLTEQWRRGYYQALMGCARCAENLEGMAKIKGEDYGKLVPWESVIGSSNPRPKPLPWDKKGRHKTPPREEEVEDAFPKPEIFYMKVLTTKGFNDRQRLDAAIAYADYLDYKGLYDTARDMYDWGLDIAAAGLPTEAGNVVDMKTGTINNGKDKFLSENMFRATTAMGVHFARMGDVQSALPVFLSVLRARRSLDPAPSTVQRSETERRKDQQQFAGGFLNSLFALKDLVMEKPYPASPTSGNDRPYHTLQEACEEVGLMTYIGEILFASSDKEREKGLGWTRDSVGAAEAVLWVMDEKNEFAGEDRCRECLETGLENWKKMTAEMARLARRRVDEAAMNSGWLGLGIGKDGTLRKAIDEVAKWEEEDAQIELRKVKTASLTHPVRPTGSTFYSA